MTPRIPWLADLRAERFLHKRMGADAHAAFSARGWVDVPIPDGVYRALLGTHRFTRAALLEGEHVCPPWVQPEA